MINQPLVSVIIIYLNGEPFFEEAIASVFAQTYTHWELLLVDDGSTDGSTEIAKRYAQQYPDKVRYLEHENHQNLGMSASRNLGIRNTQGEYIGLLDADDIWFSQKLDQQVAILENHPEAAMVYGSALWWYSWTNKLEDKNRDFCDSVDLQAGRSNCLIQAPQLLVLFLTKGGSVPCPSTILVRHQILKEIGGFEEFFRGMFEDYAFYSKLGLRASAFVSSECWIKYRRHDASCYQIAQETGQEVHAREVFLNWLEQYLAEHNISNKQVLQALRSQLLPYRHPGLFKLQQGIIFSVEWAQILITRSVKSLLPKDIRHWLKTQWRNASQ
jgi:glycosyltransferase involved in cell wall biosynthesis